MRLALRRRPEDIACRELVELLTDYLEGALPRRERVRLEAHLRGCDACRGYLADLRALIDAGAQVRLEDLSPALRRDLVDAFRGWSPAG